MAGKLQVKQVFGLVNHSENSLAWSADHMLAYNSGAHVVVLNTETKEQGLIPTFGTHVSNNQSLGATAITTSHPKKFIAVAERGENVGLVVFYDSHSLRKKRVLHYPELGSKEYKCVAFSDDGRQCLTQGAGPDWNLVLWSVEKTVKMVCSTKIALSDDNAVNQVSFCPWDSTLCVVVGKGYARLYRIIEGAFKQLAMSVRRDDRTNFLSHCWLPDEILILGTSAGEILLIENNEYRGVIYPSSAPGGPSSAGGGYDASASGTVGGAPEELTPVFCFCPTSRGFVAGTVDGEIRMFERST